MNAFAGAGRRYTLAKSFTIDAAHQLTHLPATHKCSRLHGHTYTITVYLAADRLNGDGFVRDFGELAPFKEVLMERYDHRFLNDVLHVAPTAENLAAHLFGLAWSHCPEVCAVEVQEGFGGSALYTPPTSPLPIVSVQDVRPLVLG